MSETWKNTLTLALGIALLPPLWAVAAPHIGVATGAVALICAGLYVTNGNRVSDAARISVGFLLGDAWAVLAILLMAWMPLNESLETFILFFVLGGLAVIIGALFPKLIFTPAWLCGWAIGLTVMAPCGAAQLGSLSIQIGMSMLVGVWYVGAGVDVFQKALLRRLNGWMQHDDLCGTYGPA